MKGHSIFFPIFCFRSESWVGISKIPVGGRLVRVEALRLAFKADLVPGKLQKMVKYSKE